MNNVTKPASADNLKVAYHTGGLLFAGNDRDFPAGWYLFDGEDARPVTVFDPFTDEPLQPDHWECGVLDVKKQAALIQAALTKRRKEQCLTRLQVWVTDEQKQKVLAMLKDT